MNHRSILILGAVSLLTALLVGPTLAANGNLISVAASDESRSGRPSSHEDDVLASDTLTTEVEPEEDTDSAPSGDGPALLPDDEDPDADPDAEPDIDELCPTFTDLTDSNTHYEDICGLAIDEIVLGFSDGTYLPGADVTRGQVASVIARTAGFDPVTPATPTYDDMGGTTHEGAIEALSERGIITGFEDGTFGPGDPVRRDQVASMLARWLEVEPQETGPFTDLSGIHAGNINALHDLGVIMGTTNTTFDPATNIGRDQFAALINRARSLE